MRKLTASLTTIIALTIAMLLLTVPAFASVSSADLLGEWSHSEYTGWPINDNCTRRFVFAENSFDYYVYWGSVQKGHMWGSYTTSGNQIMLSNLAGDIYSMSSLTWNDGKKSFTITDSDDFFDHTVVAKPAAAPAAAPLTASAGEFRLHGGVMFDMTVDEMVTKEKGNGLNPVKVTEGKLSFATEWGAGHTYDLNAYSAVYEVKGSFVSDSFKTIYYLFDKEGKLCQMIYCGTSCYNTAGNVAGINDALADLFSDKYGAPSSSYIELNNVSGAKSIPGKKVKDTGYLKYDLDLTSSYYQWLYPYGDTMLANIEIQGLKWDMYASGSDHYPAYSPIVVYSRSTMEAYNDAIQGQVDVLTQVMDDI